MADYTDTMKKKVGEIHLNIRDTKTELQSQKRIAQEMVRTLRALSDVFDPNCGDLEVVHVIDDTFTTTHKPKQTDSYRTIEGRKCPVFQFPLNAIDVAQKILDLEQRLDKLNRELKDEEERARKI